jgi:hypothetical protein
LQEYETLDEKPQRARERKEMARWLVEINIKG